MDGLRGVTVVGNGGVQGIYLLRIHLPTPLTLAFGRFAGGREFCLPAGTYLYVGSAMGQRGAATLAARLLRHATRSGDAPPHPIRKQLFATLQAAAAQTATPAPRLSQQKRCHWHVDFLLDQASVVLTDIYALQTSIPAEQAVADWLMRELVTAVVVPGLGASDHQGATHLLRVDAPAVWWRRLGERLAVFGSVAEPVEATESQTARPPIELRKTRTEQNYELTTPTGQ